MYVEKYYMIYFHFHIYKISLSECTSHSNIQFPVPEFYVKYTTYIILFRCSGEHQCDAYQYKTLQPENCLLINGNTSEGQGQIFTSSSQYSCICVAGFIGTDCESNLIF